VEKGSNLLRSTRGKTEVMQTGVVEGGEDEKDIIWDQNEKRLGVAGE